MKIYIGMDVILKMKFVDEDKHLVDPTTISIAFTSPSGMRTTQTYPGGGITQLSKGLFRVVVDATEDGKWVYKIQSTGPGRTSLPGYFQVTPDSEGSSSP